jgi:F0F1-type ATP synthase assembly protein I
MASAPLDRTDLNKILLLTAALSVAVAVAGLVADPQWGIRYGAVAVLATANWYALTKIFRGFTEKRFADLLTGFMLKPLLLVMLLALGKHGYIEVTSFLAGLNTFFITLLAYVAVGGFRKRRAIPPHAIPSGSAGVNG